MLLKDLEFSDILLNLSGNAFMRTLRSEEGNRPIPEEASQDFLGLFQMVQTQARKEEFAITYDTVRYRVTRLPSETETWFAVRRAVRVVPGLAQIGIHPVMRDLFMKAVGRPGLILVVGSAGQGKTTTVSALLKDALATYGDLAVTIEDPPELPLDGEHGKGYCLQLEGATSATYEAYMRKALRASARYIFLGEIRDPAMASQALKAGLNGHTVVSTMHASSLENGLQRIVELARERDGDSAYRSLADGLSGIVHQYLGMAGRSRRVSMTTLFTEPRQDDPIRQKIAAKQIGQLGTYIETQKRQINVASRETARDMAGRNGAGEQRAADRGGHLRPAERSDA